MKSGNSSSNTPADHAKTDKAKSPKLDAAKSDLKAESIKFVGGGDGDRKASGDDAKPAKAGPDVSEMYARELPKVAFPGRGPKDFRVFLDASVHAAIAKHAGEDTGVEICGVLVGDWQSDDDGPYVSITASIPGEAVANKLSEVTFTHDTWAMIHKRMDADFADKSIIGWYHTHPNFGIFLSERDCFIHEHFFNGPGQVAYVVDPVRKEEGFFVWSKGKPAPAAFYWVGKDMRTAPPIEDDKREMRERSSKESLRSSSENNAEGQRRSSGGGGGGGGASAGGRGPDAPPMLTWVSNVLFGLCLFMLGFILSKYLGSAGREAELLQHAITKGVKPGLGPKLASVGGNLGALAFNSATLSQMSVAPGAPPVDQQKMWLSMAANLTELQKQLEAVRSFYALTPEDEDLLSKGNQSWRQVLLPPPPATAPAPAPATTPPAPTPTTTTPATAADPPAPATNRTTTTAPVATPAGPAPAPTTPAPATPAPTPTPATTKSAPAATGPTTTPK